VPSFTPNKVTPIVCALLTPVRFRVTSVVPLPLVLETVPVPDVIVAAVNVTGTANVTST
jgi:hypothetical protein